MLKEFNTNKLDKLIKEKFPIIYNFKFDGLILLYGGAIIDTIMNKDIHDLDFVVLSQSKNQIEDFISKYNLNYRRNVFGGYKINYNGIEIDIFTTNDLLDTARYDVDLLFYDIYMHILIPCGPLNAYKKRTITEINNSLGIFNRKRLKKLTKFIKYITKSNKLVIIRHNIFSIIYVKFKKELKKIIKREQGIKNVKRI